MGQFEPAGSSLLCEMWEIMSKLLGRGIFYIVSQRNNVNRVAATIVCVLPGKLSLEP